MDIVCREKMSTVERLRDLLLAVSARVNLDFSGVGVIVSDAPQHLSLVPIRLAAAIKEETSALDILVQISSVESEFHDGFHVLSSTGKLILVSQYFSPPATPRAEIDRSKRFGGRYLAALFGSALPDVEATGILSHSFGLAVFQNGKEVYFKAPT